MSTLVLKGLPESLHKELKKRAKEHGRSLNKEAISILAREANGFKVPDFEPIRLKRPLTMAEILAAVDEGRD